MKKLFLIVTGCFALSAVWAQSNDSEKKTKRQERQERIDAMAKLEEEGVITHRKHTIFGGKLTNDGYGGFIEIGRARSVKKALLFQLEITERKHSKEEKLRDAGSGGVTRPFIYGKINYFYPVKLGVQMQYLLGNKGNKNGVSVTGNFGGGITLGLLRPYLFDDDKNGERTWIGYESADSLLYLDGPAYGGPGLGTGWKQLKVTPGLYVKPAVRFDYGRYNEMVSAIEVGVIGEFYSKEIPQMIYQKRKQFFFSAYVALAFGRRK
ncbi:MAG: hypothetical protein EOO03_02960 [Chitinophagaceae bacterium]|nr:MAG: hypothetical protein EOO03_02960 [Chitinophagaceae bacterium]